MEVDGPDEVRKAVRYQIKRRVDSIKLMLYGNPLDDITALQHQVCLVMKDGVLYRDEMA